MAAPRQPLNPLAQPFVSSNLKRSELSLDYQNFLSNDTHALQKIVDLNIFFLDKITRLETNISQRLQTDFRKRLDLLEREVQLLRHEKTSLRLTIATIEDATKIFYLRLEGLPESDTDNLPNLVATALSRSGVTCTTADLDMVRRVGKSKPNYVRPVLIRFLKQSKRDSILFNRFNLNQNPSDNPLWINDDVSDLTRRNRKIAKGVAAQANALGIENVKLHSDGIIIGEGKFKLHDLDLLPPLLTAPSVKTLHIENDIYFQSELSPFSNFFPALIQDSDSILYDSVEQAFQHKKAISHNNHQIAAKIMKTRDPYEHKRLGNLIDQPSQQWRASEHQIMSDLLHLKFTQNPSLGTLLINTGQKALHEATGDRRWATGSDILANATKNKSWSGNDLLGQLLEQVRANLSPSNQPTPTPSPGPPTSLPQHGSLSPMPDDEISHNHLNPNPNPPNSRQLPLDLTTPNNHSRSPLPPPYTEPNPYSSPLQSPQLSTQSCKPTPRPFYLILPPIHYISLRHPHLSPHPRLTLPTPGYIQDTL